MRRAHLALSCCLSRTENLADVRIKILGIFRTATEKKGGTATGCNNCALFTDKR